MRTISMEVARAKKGSNRDGKVCLLGHDRLSSHSPDSVDYFSKRSIQRRSIPSQVQFPQRNVILLPIEVLGKVMTFVDGETLATCSCVSYNMAQMTKSQIMWKRLCNRKWPSTARVKLNQLPGAPEYDLIRLYKGSWKSCYLDNNKKAQRIDIKMAISNFTNRGSERLISETFSIGEHSFCLWVFPKGNPHEVDYSGRALSVYLVLTNIDQRPSNWQTCAVFTLNVENFLNSAKSLEWNSCLSDNRFNEHMFNWGVHSLGMLEDLKNPENGFLKNDTLHLSASVRLMTISVRLLRERNFKEHHGFGLVNLSDGIDFEVPFCVSMTELLTKLSEFGLVTENVRIWCFNQPVASGQSLRPRKMLTQSSFTPLVSSREPMFGKLLSDGVDIDAYSFCQIYVEDTLVDDAPLNEKPTNDEAHHAGYIFVKMLDEFTKSLDYVGRIYYSESLLASDLYEITAKFLNIDCLVMTKEEMPPNVSQFVVPNNRVPLQEFSIAAADIVIFEKKHDKPLQVPTVQTTILKGLYDGARKMLNQRHTTLKLGDIEELAEKLDIPKFRVRSAFRKCDGDAEKTLAYIMEGRHLGFICDSCGETDFQGARFHCKSCNDYDLCSVCESTLKKVSHRYANIEGKWQRLYDFTDHNSMHRMNKILPVF